MKIFNLFRKLEVIILLILICSNAYSAPIPYINLISLLECKEQRYEIWVKDNEIRNIINQSTMFHNYREIYGVKVLNVDGNFINNHLISNINRAVSFLNDFLMKINDKLKGQTYFNFRGVIFDFEDNINVLNRIIININSFMLNWNLHPNILHSIIPKCFEEVYQQEDIILEDLNIDHVSFYELKRKGCVFFERLKYYL